MKYYNNFIIFYDKNIISSIALTIYVLLYYIIYFHSAISKVNKYLTIIIHVILCFVY